MGQPPEGRNIGMGRVPAEATRYWQRVAEKQKERSDRKAILRKESDHLGTNIATVTVTEGAGQVHIQRPDLYDRTSGTGKGGGKRSTVDDFSKGAARRLQIEMCSVRTDAMPLFVTLTLPGQCWWSGDAMKRMVDLIGKRWQRARWGYGLHWKMELKRRRRGAHANGRVDYKTVEQRSASAEFEVTDDDGRVIDTDTGEVIGQQQPVSHCGEGFGMEVPHLHLLIWPPEGHKIGHSEAISIRKWYERHWHQVCRYVLDPNDEYEQGNKEHCTEEGQEHLKGTEKIWDDHRQASTRSEKIRSANGIRAYVSSYFAKPDQSGSSDWRSIGRFWGRIAKARIPYGRKRTFAVLHKEACQMLRAVMRSEKQDYKQLPTSRYHMCSSIRPWLEWAEKAEATLKEHAEGFWRNLMSFRAGGDGLYPDAGRLYPTLGLRKFARD